MTLIRGPVGWGPARVGTVRDLHRKAAVAGILAVLAVVAMVAAPRVPGHAQVAPASPGSVVRVPFPQDDGSLTPYTFERGYGLMSLLYDTLLWRDANGVPQPWLATAETSEAGRRITLRLVDNASWHDGRPVTSADVEFTFRYVADHYHPRFTPELRAIESVSVPDEATVVVNLRYPSLGFADQPLADLPILPAHIWSQLAPDAVAPEGLPVGSGPFRLAEYTPGTSYRLVANPEYFRGPPGVGSIEVPVIGEATATVNALEQGRVDMIPASLPPATVTRLREALGVRVLEGTSYVGTQLLFNVRNPPFDRPEVRRAVALALDLRRISDAVGDGIPADNGYLHPASAWATDRRVHQVDETGARAELSRLGVKPFQVLAPDNDPGRREAGRQVALALQRVGVQATVKIVTGDELATAVGEDGSAPAFEAAIWPIPPLASYDPDFLRRVFGSAPKDAPLNFSGYLNPAFETLADRIAAAPDVAGRKAAVAEAVQLLATDSPTVPLFFPTGTYVHRVGGYDRWVLMKGSGIFDKRSFVPEVKAVVTTPTTVAVGSAPPGVETDDGGGGLPLRWMALGLLVVAGVVGWLISRR